MPRKIAQVAAGFSWRGVAQLQRLCAMAEDT